MSDPLASAIVKTLHYADLFDYALSRKEICRYLIGVHATQEDVDCALDNPSRMSRRVYDGGRWLTLPRRQALIRSRVYRRAAAVAQMPRARLYARLIAHLPFVRMVALTGGLAMENARDGDIDYLIVTTPKRLWLVRGMAVALVRLARWRGDHICPNYLVSENALKAPEENLYSAHEIVQMKLLFGKATFARLREQNPWTVRYLPNAAGAHAEGDEQTLGRAGAALKRLAEFVLRGRLGDRIERWEMSRKIAKLTQSVPPGADQVAFTADACCGFFSGHGRRTLTEYRRRVLELDGNQNPSVRPIANPNN
ncbi:MAG: hypothetical protein M1482_01120 [Chloroflexi bacterium]|nr:hypothetical protein [Chloroflexota bacterium]